MSEPSMEVVSQRPGPALLPYVERYVGYRFSGFSPGRHQGLPSRHLTMVLSLGAPVRFKEGPGRSPRSHVALAGGLHTSPVTIIHDGNQHGISLDLNPLGARYLLRAPAAALSSSVIDLSALLGRRADELSDRLNDAPGWGARFAVLDHVLTGALVDATPPAREVSHTWGRLVSAEGNLRVAAVAEEIGWSRRHLSERFRAELGLTPKAAARVLRFERAAGMLRRPGHPRLADIALACGYYDQAHLNRDWRALAGCTPSQWLAEELPIVQDGSPAGVPS